MFEGPAVEMFGNVNFVGFYATSLYQYYCYAPFLVIGPATWLVCALHLAPPQAVGAPQPFKPQDVIFSPEISDIYYPYSRGGAGHLGYITCRYDGVSCGK